MIYAGIGSRETPRRTLLSMRTMGANFASKGYVLRSGGAGGADTAFEDGCDRLFGQKEIFLASDATPTSMALAEHYHPAWHNCSDYAKKLHGRNAMIIRGPTLREPVDFVLYWAEVKNGTIKGGTALGVAIAKGFDIPCFNMQGNWIEKFNDFLELKGINA